MLEAMYERSPEFFVPFQKKVKFFIIDSVPNFQKTSTNNFAIVLHEKNNDICFDTSAH